MFLCRPLTDHWLFLLEWLKKLFKVLMLAKMFNIVNFLIVLMSAGASL